MTFISILIIVLGFLKLNMYLRVFSEYGRIMRLCYRVIQDSSSFSIYFYLFISLFALLFKCTGTDIGGHNDPLHGDGDDYENLPVFFSFFMYSFRAAIGDLEAPNASVWLKISNSSFMVYVIWVLWMIEIYFLLIVFLNFLIAIISQVYEEDLAMKIQRDYRQKSEMNLETDLVLTFFGLK